ncbi:uncharacterized protein KY384_006823 [Bacidia gigantensis]|uniref:uncharacterized protein n=1 Tax=Bacidia gigantensis TaxID=2732470 RepID=UPI001D05481B|nr:uncharacterized protein KY384_006823 [Bacidia gigantensis]KAG8527907.1 hypothetical protein KY384_006823 [Bacidia gigantensis]
MTPSDPPPPTTNPLPLPLPPSLPPTKPTLLATLTSPTASRAWQSAPHPTLPLLATCYADRTVRVHSLQTFHLHSTISGGHKRSIRSVAWKPNVPKNELVLATGGFDASVGLWRYFLDPDGEGEGKGDEQDFTGMGRRRKATAGLGLEDEEDGADEEEGDDGWQFAIILDGHDSEVKSVAFSAGGNFLATCSRDKSVWIWEEVAEDEFETVAVCTEHEGDVKAVSWHPEEEVVGSVPRERQQQSRLSIIRSRDSGEEWVCEAELPSVHTRSIYAVAWNRDSGRVVTCGGDGLVVVYQEGWLGEEKEEVVNGHTEAGGNNEQMGGVESSEEGGESKADDVGRATTWRIIAEIEAAHGVFEVNHVAWCRKPKSKQENNDKEASKEWIVTTGDDGTVKIWDIVI